MVNSGMHTSIEMFVLMTIIMQERRQKTRKEWLVFPTSGTYTWSFMTHIFCNSLPIHGCDHTVIESRRSW